MLKTIRRLFGGGDGLRPGMSCEESLRLLYEYLDGELDDLTAGEVKAHFDVCKACYPQLHLEERFRERLREAVASDDCPDAVRENVLAAIEEAFERQ
ncbi:MAG: zf-HC2 domain-containing protein [Longimicrobiales bacterium]|nr:zf-HC2 domain-containing protein [Longimicrobiales bacterium]